MRIRCTVLMLLAAFLMGISGGCAKNRTSPAEHSSELPSSVGESESNWKEVNADNSGLAYVQKQIHVPDSIAPSGLILCESGFLYVTNNLKTREAVYGITDDELNITSEYTLGVASEQSAISYFDALGKTACFVRCN